ncbi:hypothetical protein [Amycolatopsis sp. FDAARGOS 1241]|uniref:hypothetical protein n=1 Tax=Amycolatopsis sp. FDAARGOS 1241 TaxID=2778070 RepID=UPI0019501D71|nr:hypothetical protein [Amycolatopsis sp. FDAARGOS 1241]QRP42827.1 hypothetical protein I6J71_25525 [Amycolatopsis sp. FDAARGOS 1241]
MVGGGAHDAVDVEDLAGDERRVLEVDDRIDDVGDLAHTTDGLQALDELAGLGPISKSSRAG